MRRPSHSFVRSVCVAGSHWAKSLSLVFALLASIVLGGCAAHSDDSGFEEYTSLGEPLTAIVQVNSGAGAVSPFAADGFFSGGSTYATGTAVSTTGVTDAAPASVYQSERYGNFSYTFTGLTPNASYTVRLHFAEIYWTATGRRVFNVAINAASALANYDIFAVAGANKAVVRDFTTNATSSGQIVVTYTTVTDNAKSSGIEILTGTTPPPNQVPTIATAAAANPNPVTGTTSNLSALGADDAGEASLTYTWATTGTPPGPVTFSSNATNASKNTTATFSAAGTYAFQVTVRDQPGLSVTSNLSVVVSGGGGGGGSVIYRVNSGGAAVSPFSADQFFSGGNTFGSGSAISTSGVANAAPAAVYQTERYGNHTYTFGSLTPNAAYTVRLHFAEIYWTAVGQRRFNVAINGASALSNFDIFAVAGANTAVVRDFTVNATSSGQIAVVYTTVADNAKSSGIEIISAGPPSAPPSIATAAAASPSSVSGTTTNLSVLGADDGGEANLTYTWTTTGAPPAGVTFSANGSNAAKNVTATFAKIGSYTLQASIRDQSGQTVTSNVNVTVNATLTSLAVSPSSASVAPNASQQFAVSAADQFGQGMTAPSVSWSVSGGGSINSSGLFSAGSSSGGPFTVTATGGGKSGTASVTVTSSGGTTIFFDDFLGSSVDASKWSVMDRISDQVNGEVNCCVPSNISVSGGILSGVSKFEDRMCGDSIQAPVLEHYTSWQIQQKTAPFQYGTVEVRAKPPGGTGIWPTIWMLGYLWQESQPATANTPGHNWPNGGWCEIDIAEFWQNARNSVNCTVHFNTAGGLQIQPLPYDATTRYMVYRLQWTASSLIWSVNAEDGVGYRTLRTVTGGSVPNVPMYVIINAAIGGSGGGTPNPSTFPQTFSVDWVRVTQ
jgi:beta-glucanase (GH16 family)